MNEEELKEYMFRKFGGRDAVVLEFNKSRIADTISGGATLGELLEVFKGEDGATPAWLLSTKVSNLLEIGSCSTSSSPVERTRKRASSAEVEDLAARVVELVKGSPEGLSRGAIAEALGVESSSLSTPLLKVKKAGKLVCEGERASAVYRFVELPTSPAEPPVAEPPAVAAEPQPGGVRPAKRRGAKPSEAVEPSPEA